MFISNILIFIYRNIIKLLKSFKFGFSMVNNIDRIIFIKNYTNRNIWNTLNSKRMFINNIRTNNTFFYIFSCNNSTFRNINTMIVMNYLISTFYLFIFIMRISSSYIKIKSIIISNRHF